MLVSCRVPNEGYLAATAENAIRLIELILVHNRLPKPRFTMDIIQTAMGKRHNYESGEYDLWDFINFYEGGIRSAPNNDPEKGCFVLEYRNDAWQLVSAEYFAEVYA